VYLLINSLAPRANSEERADGERSIDLYNIDAANPVSSLFAEKIGMRDARVITFR